MRICFLLLLWLSLSLEQAWAGQVIVVLKAKASSVSVEANLHAIRDLIEKNRGEVLNTYKIAFQGLLVEADSHLKSVLESNPLIAFTSENSLIEKNDRKLEGILGPNPYNWGLNRISQVDLPLKNQNYQEIHTGRGSHVYILDTGVQASHVRLKANIGLGYSAIDGELETEDFCGSGTHTAGIVSSKHNPGDRVTSVLDQATIHPVKILSCSGSATSVATILDGIEWVIENHQQPAIAQINVNLPENDAIDAAIKRMHKRPGILVVAPAGDQGKNACGFSPGGTRNVFTVGNSTYSGLQDYRSSMSNKGRCVNLYAPGVDIMTTGHATDDSLVSVTGTYAAAALATGVAALLRSTYPKKSTERIRDLIKHASLRGYLKDVFFGYNKLLNVVDLLKKPKVKVDGDIEQTTPVPNLVFGGTFSNKYGSIETCQWLQVEGPLIDSEKLTCNPSNKSPKVELENIGKGRYVFQLRVENSLGFIGSDEITIVIKQGEDLPIPNEEKTIAFGDSMILDGSELDDPDGSIERFRWEVISVPGEVDLEWPFCSITSVKYSRIGEYLFRLHIMDTEGVQKFKDFTVVVASWLGYEHCAASS